MGPRLTGAITVLAAAQHGVVGLSQLIELGASPSQIRTMRSSGWLQQVAPRVLVIAGGRPTLERDLMVGLLCLGRDAVVSHEAAARLHGFDRCRPDAVEFTLPRHGRGRSNGLRVHTTCVLPPIDRVEVAGLRCTSATRTIIDLARARVSTVRLEAAIDSAVRNSASAPLVIHRRLGQVRGPGRWGAPRLDPLLVDSGGHTMLERRFLQAMRTAGLPRPRPQVIHRRDGRSFARVDFCFDDLDVVIEVSGRLGHSSPSERARDAQRRNELQDVGRKVFEYTYEQVTRQTSHVQHTMRERLLAAGWRAP